MPERTSVLDEPHYRSRTRDFAGPEFDTFRRVDGAVESFVPIMGLQCALLIALRYPFLMPHLDAFRKIDSLGDPKTAEFAHLGRFTPNTLRYIKILGELVELFGPLDNLRIVEIGPGFGGQCATIKTLFNPASYTLIDLPEPALLQHRYLSTLGFSNFECLNAIPDSGQWDLCISNWALTECARPVQEEYLQKVVLHCPRGFMFWSTITYGGMPDTEMVSRLPNAEILREEPLTRPQNSLIVWGHNRQAAASKRLHPSPTNFPTPGGLNVTWNRPS